MIFQLFGFVVPIVFLSHCSILILFDVNFAFFSPLSFSMPVNRMNPCRVGEELGILRAVTLQSTNYRILTRGHLRCPVELTIAAGQ